MENDEELTILNLIKTVGFRSTIHSEGIKSARMNDAIYTLPMV